MGEFARIFRLDEIADGMPQSILLCYDFRPYAPTLCVTTNRFGGGNVNRSR
jgi:hypothetical protein